MEPTEYGDRYKQINLQLTRHRYWNAALATPYGSPWVNSVVQRLMVVAGSESVDYLETVGDVTGDNPPVSMTAFTASRRIDLRGYYTNDAPGPIATISARSRAGLLEVEPLKLFEYGRQSWPLGLTLRLRYSGEDDLTLGAIDPPGADDDAPARLADFYPSLLADLGRAVH